MKELHGQPDVSSMGADMSEAKAKEKARVGKEKEKEKDRERDSEQAGSSILSEEEKEKEKAVAKAAKADHTRQIGNMTPETHGRAKESPKARKVENRQVVHLMAKAQTKEKEKTKVVSPSITPREPLIHM